MCLSKSIFQVSIYLVTSRSPRRACSPTATYELNFSKPWNFRIFSIVSNRQYFSAAVTRVEVPKKVLPTLYTVIKLQNVLKGTVKEYSLLRSLVIFLMGAAIYTWGCTARMRWYSYKLFSRHSSRKKMLTVHQIISKNTIVIYNVVV